MVTFLLIYVYGFCFALIAWTAWYISLRKRLHRKGIMHISSNGGKHANPGEPRTIFEAMRMEKTKKR